MTTHPGGPEPRRRHLFTDPGEPLIGGSDPLQAAMRYGQAQAYWGVPGTHLILPPVSAVPMPIYPAGGFTGRRWPGTNPAAMWHPLLWLPPRLQGRYSIGGTDRSVTEEDDLYAVRIGIEMTASGLYDEQTGWIDVLALAGLDTDTPTDQARVANWLTGAPDENLDSVDLSEFLLDQEVAQRNPDWAIDYALTNLTAIRTISWAAAAENLLADCESMPECESDRSALQGAATIAELGALYFRALPRPPGQEPELHWWQSALARIERVGEDKQALLTGPVGEITNRLSAIHATYWPLLEQIADQPVPST